MRSHVLTDLTVSQLWMHKPWEHARAAGLYAARFADRSLDSRIAKNLDAARVLAEKALEKGVPVSEPFTGRQAFDGVLEVIGPDEEFYEELLPEFRCVTETSGGSSLLTKASALATRVREAINIETLTDDGDTSSENESSVLVPIVDTNAAYGFRRNTLGLRPLGLLVAAATVLVAALLAGLRATASVEIGSMLGLAVAAVVAAVAAGLWARCGPDWVRTAADAYAAALLDAAESVGVIAAPQSA